MVLMRSADWWSGYRYALDRLGKKMNKKNLVTNYFVDGFPFPDFGVEVDESGDSATMVFGEHAVGDEVLDEDARALSDFVRRKLRDVCLECFGVVPEVVVKPVYDQIGGIDVFERLDVRVFFSVSAGEGDAL